MAKEILEMLVESVTMELPDTKTIHLKWPDGHNPEFKTGQFITVYWPDTTNYKRAYSLSSCALDRGFYEVTVKRDGKMGTRIVDWAKAGDKLFVIPPVGKFLPVLEPNKHLVCIAGGSGVTPFRAYAREATRRKLETKITVLYSVRQPKDIIFNTEFRELEKENPHFKFHVTCTRATPEDNWTGRNGRITPEWIKEIATDLPNTVFYACGPNALVDFAEELVIHGLGMPKEQMKTGEVGLTFMLKRTALFSAHQKLGAKLIDFGGWEMPVQYTSITDEHLAVRNAAGIFDISHMGEVTVSGAGAEAFLNSVLTNDIRKLAPGEGQYTLMCNERGGVVDDLYAYKLSGGVYFLIINASRIEADVAWLRSQAAAFTGELELTDASHQYAAIAVQGPRVKEFIDDCLPTNSSSCARVGRVTDLKKNQIGGFKFEDHNVLVSRTGYTGEDGFEIIGSDESIRHLWDKFLSVGRPFGLKPAGLGARDTLRTEVCYPLYGHELDENTTPIEAGVGFFVALDKGEFNGRSVLAEQKANGVKKKCVAFKMTDKSAPPRPHYPIWADGASVGEVVSGTQSPSLGIGIGMGYVPPEFAKPDTKIEIEIRGKRFAAVVVSKPIFRKS